MKIAVVGLGKIGLPLAAQFASKGHRVTGVDVNKETVEVVNSGREPFPGEAHLGEHLARLVPSGHLRATTHYSEGIPDADVVVVAVPLFVGDDGLPDFQWMDAATQDIATNLTPRTLVSYETTLPVGSTRNRFAPHLQQRSGLKEGSDFHVVFSPERVLTGRVFADLRKYPKLIGALNRTGVIEARKFYEAALDFDDRPDLARPNGVWDLGSAETAEMAKLAETTYRDVNIGLANQFARFADRSGIDIYQVIEACNSQSYSHIHRPGISVGGHCIPVYPRLYMTNDPQASIVREARQVNDAMPSYAVAYLEAARGNLAGVKTVVFGASYRGGVKETAFSGAYTLVAELIRRGASPVVHDPLYSGSELRELGFQPFQLGDAAECAVIHTDHVEYSLLSSKEVSGVKFVLDGRRILDPSRWQSAKILTLGAPSPGHSY